ALTAGLPFCRPEHPADDGPADLGAYRAHGTARHRLQRRHAVALSRTGPRCLLSLLLRRGLRLGRSSRRLLGFLLLLHRFRRDSGLLGTTAQHLVGGLAIHELLVAAVQGAARYARRTLLRREWTHSAVRRANVRTLHHSRTTLLVQERHQRLTNAKLRYCGLHIQLGVHTERFGCRTNRLLVARRERPQRMLNTVSELAKHLVRQVQRVLGHEVHSHSLRTNQAHYLLDLLTQRLRSVVELQVRLVKEERKSTRLNSSHVKISYAVFCLKKKRGSKPGD